MVEPDYRDDPLTPELPKLDSAAAPRRSVWPRLAGVVGVGLAVAVGMYAVYWMTAANTVRAGIDDWIEAQAPRGLSVSYQDVHIGGFPFWLDVRMQGAAALLEGRTTAEWRPPVLQARSRPWRLTEIELDLTGRHEVVAARRVTLDTRRFVATIVLGHRGAVDGRLRADGISAAISRTGDVALKSLAVDFRWRGPRGAADAPPLYVDLGADGVSVPAVWATPLGRDLATFRLIGQLTGKLGDYRDPAMLSDWRNAGGTIDVSRLNIDHGPLRLAGSGTVALDTDLQPVGAFAARIEGYMATVDALRDTGLLGPGKSTAAKLVLMVLAKRPAGQTPYIEVPISVQDRQLTIESLNLMKIPVIDWSRVLGRPIR